MSKPRIYMVAAEPSGDLLAKEVVEKIRLDSPWVPLLSFVPPAPAEAACGLRDDFHLTCALRKSKPCPAPESFSRGYADVSTSLGF